MPTSEDTAKLIKPQSIADQEFDVVRKNGFDADQVRSFLQDVANSYNAMYKISLDERAKRQQAADANKQLQGKAKALAEEVMRLREENAAAQGSQSPDFGAEREALLAEAQQEADSIRTAAQAERDKLLADAAAQAAQVSAMQQSQHEEAAQSMDDAKAELQALQEQAEAARAQAEAARNRAKQYESSIAEQRAAFQSVVDEGKRRLKTSADKVNAEKQAAAEQVAELRLEQERIQAEIDEARRQAEEETQNAVDELKAKAKAEAKVTRESAQREAAHVKQQAQKDADAMLVAAKTEYDSIIADAQEKSAQAEKDAAEIRREAKLDADAMAKKAAASEAQAKEAQETAERFQKLTRACCDILDELAPLRERLDAISFEHPDLPAAPVSSKIKSEEPKTNSVPKVAALKNANESSVYVAETAKESPVYDAESAPAAAKPSTQGKKAVSQKQKPASKTSRSQPSQQSKNSGRQLKKNKSSILGLAFDPNANVNVAPISDDDDDVDHLDSGMDASADEHVAFSEEKASFGNLLDELGIE